MIYHLFEHLRYLDFPGSGLLQYISVRSILASVTAIALMLCFGARCIRMLQRLQIGEEIRDLGLEGQLAKKGTPTMGGVMILGSILISVLLFGDLTNMYIQLLLVTLVWLGCLGFADDYIKVFRKNKEGMPGKYKILGQVVLGLAVGITVCVHEDTISTLTTIPFVKNNEFDYAWLAPGSGKIKELLQVVIYVAVIIFIITAMSNASNLTDGMDGNFDINTRSDFITVSWCSFSYTNRAYDHKASNLIGNSNDPVRQGADNLNITFAWCVWGEGCEVRMPVVTFGKVHVLNCLYDCAGNYAPAVNAKYEAEVLVEGCYFKKGVKNIFEADPEALAYQFKDNIFREKFKPEDKGSVVMPYSYAPVPASRVPRLLEGEQGAGPTLDLPVPEQSVKFTIHLMGDSTMADKDLSKENPERDGRQGHQRGQPRTRLGHGVREFRRRQRARDKLREERPQHQELHRRGALGQGQGEHTPWRLCLHRVRSQRPESRQGEGLRPRMGSLPGQPAHVHRHSARARCHSGASDPGGTQALQ